MESIKELKIPVSKSQLKKQKKIELRAKKKAERKLQDKMKKKKSKNKDKNNKINRNSLIKNTMNLSKCKLRIAIDCSFDQLMSENDIKKLVQQLQYCYSSNRRAEHPLQLYLTSINDKTKERLENFTGYKSWDVNIYEDNYKDVFNTNEIVYLTSESPNILTSLDDKSVYIIGGLVDHNHYKGLCHKLAGDGKLKHAKLAIDEHIKLLTRRVLAINHVFEILLHFTSSNNWSEAFEKTIPRRKIKPNSCTNDNDASSPEDCCDNSNIVSPEGSCTKYNEISAVQFINTNDSTSASEFSNKDNNISSIDKITNEDLTLRQM